MKRTIRRLSAAVLAAALAITLFCTINNDNGAGVNPGSSGGDGTVPDGGGNITDGGLIITVDSNGNQVERQPVYLLLAEPKDLTVKPGDTSSVLVTLYYDTSGAIPVPNARITVAPKRELDYVSNGGNLTTKANGQATFLFSSDSAGEAEFIVKYVNSGTNVSKERSVLVYITDSPPRNLVLSASPPVLAADGTSKSIISVLVKNNDNNPIVGDFIKFSSTGGTITAQSATDADGRATAQLTSERRNFTATVTATLRSNGASSGKVSVEFAGVTVKATASPEAIRPNTADTAKIRAVLLDAANNPIVGERVVFAKQRAATQFMRFDSTTNNRGEAYCVLNGTAPGEEWVAVSAAGATDTVSVTHSSQLLIISQAGGNLMAGPPNTSTFTARYTNSSGTPLAGEDLRVTVTIGMLTDPENPDPASVIFAKTLKSDDNGEIVFTVNNPDITGSATIYVKGSAGGMPTVKSLNVYYKATEVRRIELVASPAVIGINNGRAKLTATVYDSEKGGNRVRDAAISFNIIKGPGGLEYIDPPTATTGSDGTASTYLTAGSTPSVFNGVWVVASDYAVPEQDYRGVRSDTVRLTIAGPPKHITVRRNIEATTSGSGSSTYGMKLSAIASDINNNPVPDGTEVTFMAEVVGYRYYWTNSYLKLEGDELKCVTDTLPVDVKSEHYDTTRAYNPFPPFVDINKNGFPDRVAKYCVSEDSLGTTEEKVTDASYYGVYEIVNGTLRSLVGDHPAYDIDWNRNGVADPKTAVTITRTVLTQNGGGVADNELIYGQNDAGRIRVRIWAEAQGLVSSAPEEFILPRKEDVGWKPIE